MAQEERSREMPHSVILEGREKLTISGVTDVHSFDEEQVLLETVRGMLLSLIHISARLTRRGRRALTRSTWTSLRV